MRRTILRLAPKPEFLVPEPKRIEGESEEIHQKRLMAIKNLGRNWVLHPAYEHNPRHSVHQVIYTPAREEYLAEVRRRAIADRARNPMSIVMQNVRAALGVK